MDFRICPACKSSVLEDDVQDCPFCGASMSGKPSAAKPKPAVPATPPSKPVKSPSGPAAAPTAAKKASPQAVPASKPEGGENDPFDVDTTAIRKAVKLIPKPIKNRTYEVKCPMCETIGYMDPEFAGKDVQCCNPECIVPVFKSPRRKVEEAPKEAPDHRNLKIAVGGTVAVIALGTAVWYFILREEPKPVVNNEEPIVKPTIELPTLPDQKVTKVEAPTFTLGEIRNQALARIVEQSRQRGRNAAYAAHLASDTLASVGKLKEAQDQLRRLQDLGKATIYYQVQPLVEIGWRQLIGNNAAGANESAAAAVAKAKDMSQYTRDSHDAGIALGSLLIALDRHDDAEALIKQHQNQGDKGAMSAIFRAAVAGKSFDVERESLYSWHAVMPEPMRVGIVETLVSRGQETKALAFAKGVSHPASREACLAAWAGRLTALKVAGANNRIREVVGAEGMTATARCRIWSAVSSAALAANDRPLAESSLESALAAAREIPSPTGPLDIPSKGTIMKNQEKPNVGLPDSGPAHAAALAFLDLAGIQLALGRDAAAWDSLRTSVEQTRQSAPGPIATQAAYDECQKDQALVKRDLASLLKLTADIEITRAFNRYRGLVQKIDGLADDGQALRVQILRAVAERGLRRQIWDYALAEANAAEINRKQPYLDSTLPGLIKAFAQQAPDPELVMSVDGAFETSRVAVDPIDGLYFAAEKMIAAGDWKNAAESIKQAYRGDVNSQQPDRLDLLAHRLTSRVIASRPLPDIYEFIQGLFDGEYKQDAFLLLAGGSVGRGQAPELWRLIEPARDLDPVDRVACYRGFVAAIPGESKPTPPPQAETAAR